MSTPYSKVFHSFLGKITDYTYESYTDEELGGDLTSLLNSSIVEFDYPKVDIRDKDDDALLFNRDLGIDEIEILSFLMVERWIERQINNVELVKQRFSNKDFQYTSQANHLDALYKNQERVQKKVTTLKTKYSYRQTGSSYYKPDYSGLSKGD
ncbi:hypothetical protein [Paenibacillus sp. FSL E2-0178]|uniref:hypothetical protein n=1 Tax=Paenibacillus sp. FSL E2-0178 TaxID=2921361 RepID=UPI00315824DB